MRNILGLDLGPNSIGWAVISGRVKENIEVLEKILGAGSRIIPMDARSLSNFGQGVTESATAERTKFRSVRRMIARHALRRDRIHKVLYLMGFLPPHYSEFIDFIEHPGQFLNDAEPKLAWKKTETGTFEFLFMSSFKEMLAEFSLHHPELVNGAKKIPYDWTIYYLRKKALSLPVSKEELAWILLNFNRKRGYYQLGGEEETDAANKLKEFHSLKIRKVEATNDKKGNQTRYNVFFDNGWEYSLFSPVFPDWEGTCKNFIVTTDLKEGKPKKDKEGNVMRTFRIPDENDWLLVKKKTEKELEESGKTVGAYIYDALLKNPHQKVRGELINTIERKFYEKELQVILEKQQEYQPELHDKDLYGRCVDYLYPRNEAHRRRLANKDFIYLLVRDILFYQRPLKTKKSLIAECPFEYRVYKEKGELKKSPVKCIPKSHPLYQEFRLWKFIGDLRIYQREKMIDGKLRTDVDVTADWLKDEADYVALFDWLNGREMVTQDALLKTYFKVKKEKGAETLPFRWNYVEEKSYPCNKTHAALLVKLKKAGIAADFLTKEIEEELWHLLYSVTDERERRTALSNFTQRPTVKKRIAFAGKCYELDEKFVDTFVNFPLFEKEYGAYSAKAIKKLLALMRRGVYWQREAIDAETLKRIYNLVTGECDETIRERVRAKTMHLSDITDFRGLPEWLALYVIYDRYTESGTVKKWETPDDLDRYILTFKQHSLRNPVVERVVLETLRVVRDIWRKYGKIDEIRVELGREMKLSAEERKKRTNRIAENETANLRIKYLLREFKKPEYQIENVRPYSLRHQDLLRIYEEEAWNNADDSEQTKTAKDIFKRLNKVGTPDQPSGKEVLKYKLWLEQKYRSPYTGEIIPLAKLFTPAYQIEHIIPKERFYDDSFSNKVICESNVNNEKGISLGYEFIKKNKGRTVKLNYGEEVKLFTVSEYEEFVKRTYTGSRNKRKKEKLLMEEIPLSFGEKQMNDTRYISKLVRTLLSNIVREEGEQEVISKHVISCTGVITDRLKTDWGIKDVWNELILPRFERMGTLKVPDDYQFTAVRENSGKKIPAMPLELQRGFDKKRIDHRHHAMDAIVIACVTRNIVNYLNNMGANENEPGLRYDLKRSVCERKATDIPGKYECTIKKPWATFTQDTRNALKNMIISFKQNLRVLTTTTNYYQHYNEEGKKVYTKQVKGDNRVVRRPLHEETFYGKINLRETVTGKLSQVLDKPEQIKDTRLRKQVLNLYAAGYGKEQIMAYFKADRKSWKDKIEVYRCADEQPGQKAIYTASRKALDYSFTVEKIKKHVADSGIQKILCRHLENYGGDAKLAFSPEGIEAMNKGIRELNNGKFHQPIVKVRCHEKGGRFPVGITGNKWSKYVQAKQDTNLYFGVYESEERKRSYATIPLNVVVERLKLGYSPVPETDNRNAKLLFSLSPGDLVYVPTEDEVANGTIPEVIDPQRVYKMVSSSDSQCFFIPHTVAFPILKTTELGANNKAERAWSGEMVKEICIPLEVDKLGNVVRINKRNNASL